MIVPSVFIHQQSMVLETVTRFISASPQCFTEDDHPFRHGSSFNKQKLWGGMIAIYVTQVFVFITSIAVIFTFDGFMVLLISVLKHFVLTGHFILSAFLSFCFRLNSKYVSFMLLQPARVQLLHWRSKPHYTPRKITTRTTARKCGIGMVSKLWLHLFFSGISLNLLSCVSHGFLKSCIEKSYLHTIQQMFSFTVHDWVPVTAICTILQFWIFFSKLTCAMQLCSDHIAAESMFSFYKATTRGPTAGGATTLEDELVWLDRIKRGRV